MLRKRSLITSLSENKCSYKKKLLKTYNLSCRWFMRYHSSIRSPPPPHHTVPCSTTTVPYMYVQVAIFKQGQSQKFHDFYKVCCKVFLRYKNFPQQTTILRHEQPYTDLYPYCSITLLRYGS